MKLAALILKTLKENIRDWKVLVLVLLFSPFFVFLMYLFYGGGPTVYRLGVMDSDKGPASAELVIDLLDRRQQDGSRLFEIVNFTDRGKLGASVRDKTVDVGIVIPEDYSEKLAGRAGGNASESAAVDFYASMGNARYTVAAALAADAVYRQGMTVTGITLPSGVNEIFLEKKQPLNDFEGYVPGLISLAVLMILFSAAASIVKENDKKTLIRLKLSRLGAFNLLLGISLVQAAIGTAAIVLAYWTALALGYRPAGGFGPVLAIGAVSGFSMVAVSLVVASFLNTVYDVLTVGCFPFFILMFFSGGMFPVPGLTLFSAGGRSFGITDILPLTHTAAAFNKILNYGSDLSGVGFELLMIVVLTIAYFMLGLALYRRRKLSKA